MRKTTEMFFFAFSFAAPIDEYAFSYTYGINLIHAQVAKADILCVEELILVRALVSSHFPDPCGGGGRHREVQHLQCTL